MFCFVSAPEGWNYNSLKAGKTLLEDSSKLFYTAPQKPKSDSFVIEENGEILILEGVVANAPRLITSHALGSLPELIRYCIANNSTMAQLHGQFFVVQYNRASKEFKVFSNATNSVRLYYYNQAGVCIVSDKMKTIVRLLAENGIKCAIDEIGARMVISFRYMLEDYTTIANIKQIGSASYIKIKDGMLTRGKYMKWKPETVERTAKQTYGELTDIFSTSVKDVLTWDGDRKHLSFLSGGLDSRLTTYTAHKLGFKDLSVLNFSEPGYVDQITAKAIADELSLKLLFHSLAHGEYLKHVADNLVYNEGQISTYGAAHLYSGIRSIDLAPYGFIQSGLFGELIKGFCLQAKHHTKADPLASIYTNKTLSGLGQELNAIGNNYPNHEQFILGSMGLNGMINGDLACYQLTHSLSPYLDPTFIQYALSIDPALRYKNYCQINWMKTHYPEAAKHKWDQTNAPVSDPFWLTRVRFYARWGSNRIMRKLTKKPNRLSMIPHDYWWQENASLRESFHAEVAKLAGVQQSFSKELQTDVRTMLQSSRFSDRYSALSLLQSTNYLLND